ncbi:uncharacterized protein LOC135482608 [Lineus longissimus]|uniref:uncharacterized protein LOC135482608 n=1 Tax=Lineus longissimus TaxID=88925 RepID=UPI00315DAE67
MDLKPPDTSLTDSPNVCESTNVPDTSLTDSTNVCESTNVDQSANVSDGNDETSAEITSAEKSFYTDSGFSESVERRKGSNDEGDLRGTYDYGAEISAEITSAEKSFYTDSGFSESVERKNGSNDEGDLRGTYDYGIDLQSPDNSVHTKDINTGSHIYKMSSEDDSETSGLTEGSQNVISADFVQVAPEISDCGSDLKPDSSPIESSASLISVENIAGAASGQKSDSIVNILVNHEHIRSDNGSDLTGTVVQSFCPDDENNCLDKENEPRRSGLEPFNDSGLGAQFPTYCEESVASVWPDGSTKDVISNELNSAELALCKKTEIKTNPTYLTKNPESENVVRDPSVTSPLEISSEIENNVSAEGISDVQKRGRGRKCSLTKTKSVSVSPRRSTRVTAFPHRLDLKDVTPAKRKRKVSVNNRDNSNTVADTSVAEDSISKRNRKVPSNDHDTRSNTVSDTGAEKSGNGRGVKKSRTQSAPSKRLAKKSAKAEDEFSDANLVKMSDTKKRTNSASRKPQAVKVAKPCEKKALLTGRGRKRAQILPLQQDLPSSSGHTKKRKINVETEKPRDTSPSPSRNLDALLKSLKTPSKLLKHQVEMKIRDSPPVRGRRRRRSKTREKTEVATESVCTDDVSAKSVSNGNDLGRLKQTGDDSPDLGLGPSRSSQTENSRPYSDLETALDTADESPRCLSKICDSSPRSAHRDYSPDLGLGPSRPSLSRNLDLESERDTLDEPPSCLSKNCDSSLPSEHRSVNKVLEELPTTSKLPQPRAKPARKPAAVKPARNAKDKKGLKKTKSSVYACLLEDLENPVAHCLGSFESAIQTSDDALPTKGKENCDDSVTTAAIAKRVSANVMPYDPNLDWSGDSCKEDEEDNDDDDDDDDDDDLPEAFYSSPAQTSAPKFSKGDFVWVKWNRYPYWPCMIRNVYYTKRRLGRLSILFVGDSFEKGQKGFKVRYTKKAVRGYSCPERAQFIDEGKNSSWGSQFEAALNLIKEFLTKKGLGLTEQSSLEYFTHVEETWTDDEDDTPLDTCTLEPRLKTSVEENREKDSSEDEDQDTNVMETVEDTPRSKRLAEIKMTRRERYKEMVEFIQSDEVKNYLFEIYMGKRKSLLNDQFKTHPSGKDLGFGPIDDDSQIEEIQNTLMIWFNEINTGSSIDVTSNLNYVLTVWVPEAIVYAMRKTKHYTTKTAWERFGKGVYWTKVEHENAHLEILNAVQNTSAESLEMHRMRTEAKTKRFFSGLLV